MEGTLVISIWTFLRVLLPVALLISIGELMRRRQIHVKLQGGD